MSEELVHLYAWHRARMTLDTMLCKVLSKIRLGLWKICGHFTRSGACVCVRVEKLMTRAEIERDYAKRLSKLAKTSLGKYETGYVV